MKKLGVRFVFIFVLVSVVGASFFSCRRSHYDVRLRGIDAAVNIARLDMELFGMDPAAISGAVPGLKRKYGDFLQLFGNVTGTGSVDSASFGAALTAFCTDRLNCEVYDSVAMVFPDLKDVEAQLSDAFRHYKYYFPNMSVPMVYACMSGFNSSIIVGDSALGIGLDRYLGARCGYYPRLGIYRYVADRMTPENVVTDCVYAWGASEWDFDAAGYGQHNALAEIIHAGKLKYFEKCLLPDVADELIFGFTPEQIAFCRNNEGLMWNYAVEHDLLFSTDQMVIRRLTGEAPFTSYFTAESPGRAAVWLGFKIIESYMMRNTGVSLAALMAATDIQDILAGARYAPK
jgi:hypothetical protein